MKTIPVSYLLAGMLLPSICFALPPETSKTAGVGEKGGRGAMMRSSAEAWKLADADHDGFISTAEFGSMPRTLHLQQEKREKLFKRFDKDSDGKLSREELGQLVKPHDGQSPKRPRLWELDTDKSGGISFDEFKMGEIFIKLSAEKQTAVFRRLDTDSDGMITPKDRPEPPFKHPAGPKARTTEESNKMGESGRINLKLDTNGDGAVSFEEFRAGAAVKNLTEDEQEDRFQRLDRNGDLKLSTEDSQPPAGKSKP